MLREFALEAADWAGADSEDLIQEEWRTYPSYSWDAGVKMFGETIYTEGRAIFIPERGDLILLETTSSESALSSMSMLGALEQSMQIDPVAQPAMSAIGGNREDPR